MYIESSSEKEERERKTVHFIEREPTAKTKEDKRKRKA